MNRRGQPATVRKKQLAAERKLKRLRATEANLKAEGWEQVSNMAAVAFCIRVGAGLKVRDTFIYARGWVLQAYRRNYSAPAVRQALRNPVVRKVMLATMALSGPTATGVEDP